MRCQNLFQLTKEAAIGWYQHRTFELGAALAFYGVFALAPTLVIAIAVAGMVFGEETAVAQENLVARLEQVLSPAVARALAETLSYVYINRSGWIATTIGFAVLIFGIIGAFGQLQAALNSIWGVQTKASVRWWDVIRDRLLGFVLALVCWGLILTALAATAVLQAVRAFMPWSLPEQGYLWDALNWALSLALLTLLFAMIYKLLPDIKIRWRAVWVGAALTAVLFTIGNYLIGLYLGRSAAISAYGAAGSVVVVMLWVYYSSQVILFGAEFTRHFADRCREPVQPAENAEKVVPQRGLAGARQ
jgi:membrane protein